MKYRRLSKEELNNLEKEFIDFLVINGIAADDWQSIKKDRVEDADAIIDQFSDVVFEGIMRKTHYLEFHAKHDVKTFHCQSDKIILMGLEAPEGLDLTDKEQLSVATKNPPKGVKIYTTEKSYDKSRETEIYEMISKGCEISDGKLYKALTLIYYQNK